MSSQYLAQLNYSGKWNSSDVINSVPEWYFWYAEMKRKIFVERRWTLFLMENFNLFLAAIAIYRKLGNCKEIIATGVKFFSLYSNDNNTGRDNFSRKKIGRTNQCVRETSARIDYFAHYSCVEKIKYFINIKIKLIR